MAMSSIPSLPVRNLSSLAEKLISYPRNFSGLDKYDETDSNRSGHWCFADWNRIGDRADHLCTRPIETKYGHQPRALPCPVRSVENGYRVSLSLNERTELDVPKRENSTLFKF